MMGNVPSTLSNGELAINTTDQLLYYRHSNGSIVHIANGKSIGIDQFARDRANVPLIVTHIYSTIDQVPPNTNPYIVTFSAQPVLNESTYTTANSFVRVLSNGVYKIEVVGHVWKTKNGSSTNFLDCWIRRNGINVPTTSRVTVPQKDTYHQISLQSVAILQANDTIQVMQRVNSVVQNFGLVTDSSVGGTVPSITMIITRFRQ